MKILTEVNARMVTIQNNKCTIIAFAWTFSIPIDGVTY